MGGMGQNGSEHIIKCGFRALRMPKDECSHRSVLMRNNTAAHEQVLKFKRPSASNSLGSVFSKFCP